MRAHSGSGTRLVAVQVLIAGLLLGSASDKVLASPRAQTCIARKTLTSPKACHRLSAHSEARWLSWLERRPVTAEVVGSIPIRVAIHHKEGPACGKIPCD